MKKRLLALCCALAVAGAATAKIVGATSPGGNLRLEIEVADKISYTVWSGADKVLDACTLSLTLDDRTLGSPFAQRETLLGRRDARTPQPDEGCRRPKLL